MVLSLSKMAAGHFRFRQSLKKHDIVWIWIVEKQLLKQLFYEDDDIFNARYGNMQN